MKLKKLPCPRPCGRADAGPCSPAVPAAEAEEDRLVAEAVADIFKGNSQNVEVSYSVPR